MARFNMKLTDAELEQIKLAARLRHISLTRYVKAALNAAMVKQGVDAVLFYDEGEDERVVCKACERPVYWHTVRCVYECGFCGRVDASARLVAP